MFTTVCEIARKPFFMSKIPLSKNLSKNSRKAASILRLFNFIDEKDRRTMTVLLLLNSNQIFLFLYPKQKTVLRRSAVTKLSLLNYSNNSSPPPKCFIIPVYSLNFLLTSWEKYHLPATITFFPIFFERLFVYLLYHPPSQKQPPLYGG